MGALFAWIIRGLAYAGPAAIGYFFNDVATWFSSLMPQTNVRDTAGKFSWWFVLLVLSIVGGAFLLVFSMFSGKKKMFSIGLLVCFAFDCLTPGLSLGGVDYIAAGVLGVVPGSAAGFSFSIDYCPQILIFENADFSNLRIEVKDDGQVFNLDTDGLQALEDIGFVGSDTAGLRRAYRLSNGFVLKTTTFTATNTNVAARTIRGFSQIEAKGGPNNKGLWTEYAQTKAFANVEFRLRNFQFAAFPSAAVTDSFTLQWSTGKSDNMNSEELRVLLASSQFNETVAVDNRAGQISEIRFTGAAEQTVYYTKLKAVL